jgi:hypothetical protein
MCQILVPRRVQVTHVHRLKLQIIPLSNDPHVRILLWSSLLPFVRVMLGTIESKDCKGHAHEKASAQDDKKNDQSWGYQEAHVISLLQGHGVDMRDMHFPQRMVLN